MKRFLIVVLFFLCAAGTAYWLWAAKSSAPVKFRYAKVERGDIVATVAATGAIQPMTQLQVGTQVTGVIKSLFADFNSRVAVNQVIAQIDPAQFEARVNQDKANLARSLADVDRVKATLVQAEKELARSKELLNRGLVSQTELDAAKATYDSTAAQVKVAEAVVAQSKAALDISEVNLQYTTIVSPIDGTVISRNVEVGQTVSASLQAPTLFVIADNLKNIQLQASVAEADIGKIFVDQSVKFTVDAYRENSFDGKVAQIRLSPTTVQNVVTYTVIINAQNPNEKLLPGMTANVVFEISRSKGVIKVPNSALRFIPPAGSEVAEKEEGRPRGNKSRNRVWVGENGGCKSIPVAAGITDGAWTEIAQGELTENQEIIIGVVQEGQDEAMKNPLAPSYIRRPMTR